jgi:SAM-dependent methyltransferase
MPPADRKEALPKPSWSEDPEVVARQYRSPGKFNARLAFHRLCSVNQQPWYPWVFSQIESVLAPTIAQRRDDPNLGPISILEVGSGPAELWRAVGAQMPSDWLVTVTDLSKGMVHAAEGALKGADRPAQFQFHVCDAQDLPFPDCSFDLVIANHVLYQVLDRDQALMEFKRVLRPGGTVMAATDGTRHLQELMAIALPYFPSVNRDRFGDSFGFGTGLLHLADHFNEVTFRRYFDELVVDTAEKADLAIGHLLSTPHGNAASAEAKSRFAERVHFVVSHHGPWRITKEMGVFTARHPTTIDPDRVHALHRGRR